jgi:2-polyprenyl-6-methoxyphenol hydroxylase-like FAD-dependent oxidoreductase
MHIAIVGGGIGGLTLGLMLHRRGVRSTILESAAQVRPLGVGINALPHAIRELAGLDLLPALDAVGIRTRQLTYANHLGQTIWSEPRGTFGGHEWPQFSLHRGRLQSLLWDAAQKTLGPDAVRANARMTGFQTTGDRVLVSVGGDAPAEIEADALIGADGIHSTLRSMLFPADPGIRWNGIQMWRGAVDWPIFDGGDAMVIAGDAVAKLVLYPIGPGDAPGTRLTNWVVYARVADASAPPPARESWSELGSFDEIRPLIERFRLPFIDIEALARATSQIFKYPMCDRDPLPWWSKERVTLLGDAAHSMYPVGSNGASQAILDARCLADLLATRPVVESLAAYEAERLPKTAEVVRSNRVGGPERVIDLVANRAPNGFSDLGAVASHAELADAVRGYANLAGFAVPSNAKAAT